MTPLLSFYACLFTFLAFVCGFYLLRLQYPRPPGPRGIPVVGNILSMPRSEEWLYWARLGSIFGSITSVTVLGQRIVTLNTIQVCDDLLTKRSSIYSGRPVLEFAGKMVGWDQQLILTQYGNRHRAMRKMFARHVGSAATITEYKAAQEEETRRLILALAESPQDFLSHLRSAVSAMFLKITHGYSIERRGPDPLIALIEKAAHQFYIAAAPGAWLVDLFPWLRFLPAWLPGARFQHMAEQFRKVNFEQIDVPIRFVTEQMASDSARPSFVSRVLRSDLNPLDREIFPYVAGSLYAGGQDTVTATLGTFFLAMVLYPDAQQKAQEEISRVLGTTILPAASDISKLPYISALFKEVMRWHTVACMNLPHYTTEGDMYSGYFIPKGSIVLANLWAIANDPSNYSDPSAFKPERFLGDHAELDPSTFVFGFGRRRCPGIELAHTVCIYIIVNILTIFDIVKAQDANQNEITPEPEFYSATVWCVDSKSETVYRIHARSHPKPFPCRIKTRSKDAEILLKIMSELESNPEESDAAKLNFSSECGNHRFNWL